MSIFDLYKPLRNQIGQLSLIDSLRVVRAYLLNLQFKQDIPADIEVGATYRLAPSHAHKGVYAWELDILAKEIILNAPLRGNKTMRHWPTFSEVVNRLKDLENETALQYDKLYTDNILLELYRIAHRQFPWQQRPNTTTLTRYFKIFEHRDIDQLVRRKLGLTASELYTLGLIVTGYFLKDFAIEPNTRFDVPGFDREQLQLFLSHFSSNLVDLQKQIREAQSYDQDFAYAFNPLMKYPLVRCPLDGKLATIAPIPTYLIRRFTEGVYYEICNEPEFAASFGKSFQKYTGEVANAANMQRQFAVLPEEEYIVRKDRKDSVDWIIADSTATLFVECKTKKLRYGSKFRLADTQLLDEDLDKMASFVVQMYKTLTDALASHYPHWKPIGTPVYPIITTLEDWYVSGPQIVPAIEKRVDTGMRAANLDVSLLKKHPYTVCSIADFERAMQVMNHTGIEAYMAPRFSGEQRLWNLHTYTSRNFIDQLAKAPRDLFPGDTYRIHPSFKRHRR